MTFFKTDIIDSILNSLGWTILHSLWLGLVFLVCFLLTVILFRRKKAQFKYLTGLIVLILFLGSVFVTFILTYNHQRASAILHNTATDNSFVSIDNHANGIKNIQEQFEIEPKKHTDLVAKIEILRVYLNKSCYFIALIWLVFASLFLAKHLFNFYKLKQLITNPLNRKSSKWQTVINGLSSKIYLNRSIRILISPFINSPFVFGIVKPVILLPIQLVTQLSEDEIKSILIHELAHISRNDYVTNLFQVVIESLFFYHPGIKYISEQMRVQREVICDTVAAGICENKKTYVNALVKVEELRLVSNQFAVAAKRNKNELLYRIKCLLSNRPFEIESKKSFNLLLPLVILLAFFGFTLAAFKSRDTKENQQSHFYSVVAKHLSPAKSSMVVFDTRNEQYLVFNDSISHQRYTPASTFKITSSLIALESGIAENESFTIRWDSIRYPREPWMNNSTPQKFWLQNHTLQSALKYSVNWFYLELHRLIGRERIQNYINQCNYGNNVEGTSLDNFWFNGTLKISAFEQVEFLKKLNSQSLTGFSRGAQKKVKAIMLNESMSGYKIYGKSGTGEIMDNKLICWYVGMLEVNNNTYIFAFNSFTDNYNELPADKRIETVKKIFHGLDIINILK